MDKRSFRYILLIITISILLIFLMWNINPVLAYLGDVMMILRPIFIGIAIAFILYKPTSLFRKLISKLLNKIFKKHRTDCCANVLSILAAYIFLILIITGIVLIIVPQFVTSIKLFKDNIGVYFNNFQAFANNALNKINQSVPANVNINEKINSLSGKLPEISSKIFMGAFGFTTSLIKTVADIFFGLIISVYLLASRHKLKLQAKKIIYAKFNNIRSEKIISFLKYVSQVFTNFITGQIIEAFILGFLCFIFMNIFGFEYPVLISTLVGLTNVIPIVGPIIGTIPSFLLLLLINPIQAFWFIVFIICLQQFESNVIYPRVVGTQVGLPALWVIVAVLVGGGLFGIIGMLFAVPTMYIIYDLTRKRVKEKLDKKKLDI